MVRGAITPMADVQMEAVNWMKSFFEVQGDHCPDSGDIKLRVDWKARCCAVQIQRTLEYSLPLCAPTNIL